MYKEEKHAAEDQFELKSDPPVVVLICTATVELAVSGRSSGAFLEF